jgi:hypothetical protein
VYCDADRYPPGHQAPRSLNVVHPTLYSRPMNGTMALRAVGRALSRRITRSRRSLS